MSAHDHEFHVRLNKTLEIACVKLSLICYKYGLKMSRSEVGILAEITQFTESADITTPNTFYADASAQLLNWLAISRWMKAAPFTNIQGALTTIHGDLNQLKTIEKGIKDVTTELLLHQSAYRRDDDVRDLGEADAIADDPGEPTPRVWAPDPNTYSRRHDNHEWDAVDTRTHRHQMHARLMQLNHTA